MMPFFDPRMEQVRKIVESIVTKSMFDYTKVLISNDNTLVIIVDNTLLYQIPLKSTENCMSVAFIYKDIYDFENPNECINDTGLIREINHIRFIYNTIATESNLLASDKAMKDNEEFAKFLSLSSDEGFKYYSMRGLDPTKAYLIPMFSGFITLNNGDNLDINLYSIDDKFILQRMKIFKKKINRDMIVDCKIIKV